MSNDKEITQRLSGSDINKIRDRMKECGVGTNCRTCGGTDTLILNPNLFLLTGIHEKNQVAFPLVRLECEKCGNLMLFRKKTYLE